MRNHDNSVSNLDEGLLSALINFRKAEPNTDSFFLSDIYIYIYIYIYI